MARRNLGPREIEQLLDQFEDDDELEVPDVSSDEDEPETRLEELVLTHDQMMDVDVILDNRQASIKNYFFASLVASCRQCWGSRMIYSGSSFEFSEFRIQAKVPDPDCIRIRFADPDPGGENLREKTEKMRGKLKFYYKILTKCGQTQLFVSIEQSFWPISTLCNVLCYKFG